MKKCFGVLTLILCAVAVFCCCSGESESNDSEIIGEWRSETGKISDEQHNVKSAEMNESVNSFDTKTDNDVNKEKSVAAEIVDSEISVNQRLDEDENTYEKLIKEAFSGFDGKLSYGIHMYDSGYVNVYNNSQMKSASVIKLFIMEYAFELLKKGEISSEDVVSGSKVSNLVERMITVSDNDATNALIKHFGIDKINAFIKEKYSETTIQRQMLDTAAAQRGEENYTSVADVMKFLDMIYNNKERYPYSEMLEIMKRQQISTKLRRNMPSGVKMASKTGELSDVENDVAIVFSDMGDYAIVCLTKGGSADVARNAMAKACRNIYDELQKK